MFKKELSFKEIVLGIVLGFLSYILIAVFNISNEDIYNWDISLIFSEGGFLNSAALIAFWLWFVAISLWILSVVIRIIRLVSKKIQSN